MPVRRCGRWQKGGDTASTESRPRKRVLSTTGSRASYRRGSKIFTLFVSVPFSTLPGSAVGGLKCGGWDRKGGVLRIVRLAGGEGGRKLQGLKGQRGV